MFDDLITLFSGWYLDFIGSVKDILVTEVTTDGADVVINSTAKSIDVWSAYVPWEQIIAAVVLIVMVCSVFKLLRSVLCKIL